MENIALIRGRSTSISFQWKIEDVFFFFYCIRISLRIYVFLRKQTLSTTLVKFVAIVNEN